MSFTEELVACKSKDSVEKLWLTHGITAYEKKIEALRESMGNPITFYCSGKEIDCVSKEYAVELEIFLLGEWRIIDLYKKAGM